MGGQDSIVETIDGSIKIVKLNRPNKKNAFDGNTYLRLTNILDEVKNNNDIQVMVLTGAGDFYSSGDDIKDTEDHIPAGSRLVEAFITFPKILVAIVNGPAIGIAATTLALCDLVFASEDSYFYTPFTQLGLSPEGCSTLTFPKLLGYRKALDLLLFNYKMPAQEALDSGFVNYLYKNDELDTVWEKIREISNLRGGSLRACKRLVRVADRAAMMAANRREMRALAARVAQLRGQIEISKI